MLPHATPVSILKQDSEEETKAKVHELLSKLQHKPKGYLGLEILWKDTVAEVYGDFVPALTAKEQAQLKMFAKKCPAGAAAEILEFCLRHWLMFVKAAEENAGAFKTPLRPQIGFLLRYAAVAINLWTKQHAKPKPVVQKPPAPVPVQSIAKPPPADPYPTKAGFYQIFFGKDGQDG